MIIEVTCPFCSKKSTLDVDHNQYKKFVQGELVQRAFPKLKASQRELLITGMCQDCQDKTFGKDEE